MFKFLKEKLKKAVKKFGKGAEEKAAEKVVESEKAGEVSVKVESESAPVEVRKRDRKAEKKSEKVEKKEDVRKGVFSRVKERVGSVRLSEAEFEKLFWEIESVLLENNAALSVIEKIHDSLAAELVGKAVKRGKVEEVVKENLRGALEEVLDVPKVDLVKMVKECKRDGRSCLVLFLGFNGVGKSLSVAKVAKFLKSKKLKVLIAAGDTFRAAGIEQVEKYAKDVGVDVVRQGQGSDSCAVIFDAVKSASSKGYDVVLADTAGRTHEDENLLDELGKIVRVNKPDLKVLVLDALTGSDVVSQAERFDKAAGVDALIFSKADVYEEGGGILSATYVLGKPVLFLGVGQKFSDLEEFDAGKVLSRLGF